MFKTIFQSIWTALTTGPFTGATWLVLGIIGFIIWVFAKASKDPKSPINWEDMVIDNTTQKTSPYKLGYLIGIIVSTWVIIDMENRATLTFDMFGLYLAFLVGGVGVTNYVSNKFVPPPPPGPVPPQG